MDRQGLKRELTELAHYVWCIGADITNSDYDIEIQPRLNMALKRFCKLKIQYNRYTAQEIASNCGANDRYIK